MSIDAFGVERIEKGLAADWGKTLRTVARGGAHRAPKVRRLTEPTGRGAMLRASRSGQEMPDRYAYTGKHKVGKSALGVEELEKDSKQPSSGRYATGYLFAGSHGLVAGRKGKKLRAAGSEVGHQLGGGIAGGLAGAAPGALLHKPKLAAAGYTAGAFGGGIAGSRHAVQSNQRQGRYKRQVTKSAFGVEHISKGPTGWGDLARAVGDAKKADKVAGVATKVRPSPGPALAKPKPLPGPARPLPAAGGKHAMPGVGATSTNTGYVGQHAAPTAKPLAYQAGSFIRNNSLAVAGGTGAAGLGAGALLGRKKNNS